MYHIMNLLKGNLNVSLSSGQHMSIYLAGQM